MVRQRDGKLIPFENLDLDRLSYRELQDLRNQLKRNIMAVAGVIEEMEECPDRDDEICQYQEAEYLRKQDEAEKNMETYW